MIQEIVESVKKLLPIKYHRPYIVGKNLDDIFLFDHTLLFYPNGVLEHVAGMANFKKRLIMLYEPGVTHTYNTYKDTGFYNGSTGETIEGIESLTDYVSYVYLHESGHLASGKDKKTNRDEKIVDCFARHYFKRVKSACIRL